MSNIITSDEMAVATDDSAPVTPARFLPYRKLLAAIVEAEKRIGSSVNIFEQSAAQFEAIGQVSEHYLPEHLATTGESLIWDHVSGLTTFRDQLVAVIESAKATMPRKRWDESACHDDRPDEEDIAKERAASVDGESEAEE
jgi:hypothetical protein